MHIGVPEASHLVVKNINTGNTITLIFNLCGKPQEMNREKDQSVAKTFSRILINKKKLSGPNGNSNVKLLDLNGNILDTRLSNAEAFKNAIKMVIDQDTYDVTRENKLLKKISIDRYPVVGLTLDFKVSLCDYAPDSLPPHLFRWYRVDDDETEKFLSSDATYIPTKDDIGKYLKLRYYSTWKDNTIIETCYEEARTNSPVMAYTGPFLYQSVKMLPKNDNTIRVVSYNILAAFLTKTAIASQMYGDNTSFYIDKYYRHRILLKELIYYDADILGLQEVTHSFYYSILKNYMEDRGYLSSFKPKNYRKPEGCAIFYKKERFTLVNEDSFVISESFEHESLEKVCQLQPPSFLANMASCVQHPGSVFLILHLHDNITNRDVLVSNTHLYYHPSASTVRLLQTYAVLSSVQWFRDFIALENPEKPKPTIIMTGDWNSHQSSEVVRLILTGQQDMSLPTSDSELFEEATLNHDLFLFSASGFPEFSTSVSVFQGLLDYIFADGHGFKRVHSYGIPPRDLILKYGNLPAPHVPSDHLPVMCDIQYKQPII